MQCRSPATLMLAAVSVVLLMLPAAVLAQNRPQRQGAPGSPEGERRGRAERRDRPDRPDAARAGFPDALASVRTALDSLTLSDAQKAQADEIFASATARMAEARKAFAGGDGGGGGGDAAGGEAPNRREAFRKMTEIARATTEEITGILDEDQKLLFNQNLQEARQQAAQNPGNRFGAGGPGGRGDARGPGAFAPRSLPLDRAIEQAATRLDLTDEQKQKVQALGSDVNTKMQALHEEAIKQLRIILTAEQFQQFERMQARPGPGSPAPAAGAGAFGGGRGGPGAGGPLAMGERLRQTLEQLDLSEDQKARIKPVLDDFQKTLSELRAQFQPGQGAPAGLREKLRTAIQDVRARMQEILTPEQMEKLRGALEPGGRRFGGNDAAAAGGRGRNRDDNAGADRSGRAGRGRPGRGQDQQ